MNEIRTRATAARLVALSVVVCFIATSGHWGRRLLAVSLSSESAQPTQSAPSSISSYSIRWISDQDSKLHSVEVTGLTNATLTRLRSLKWKLSDWQRLLRVQVEPQNGLTPQKLPAMLGAYRV